VVVLLLDVGEPEVDDDELAVGVPPAPPTPAPPTPAPPIPTPLLLEVPRAPVPVEPSLFDPPPLQCVSATPRVSKESDCNTAKRMEVSLFDPHCLSHGSCAERFAFVVGLLSFVAIPLAMTQSGATRRTKRWRRWERARTHKGRGARDREHFSITSGKVPSVFGGAILRQ
jgi:hypothetical protein